MQEIVELDSLGKQISEKICEYCKPLMLQKEEKKERTRLLSCETDLQLSLQYALEAESAAGCIEKLKLTKEECEIIVYTLRIEAKDCFDKANRRFGRTTLGFD